MKNLIVNADDLGWTEGVNRGIFDAFRGGIVTSATLLANGTAFAEAVKAAKSAPGLAVGVHLNLSDGAPVADPESVTSLLNDDGNFAEGPEGLLLKRARGGLILDEVEEEWDAQIQKVRDAGIRPTHLDGHKHVHMLPGLFEIALRLAKRHGIEAIRVSPEESNLRAALASGSQHRTGVVMKQGVQARGLKLLARDARKQAARSEEHTSELQSQSNLVCRLLLEKKKSTIRHSGRSPVSSRQAYDRGRFHAIQPPVFARGSSTHDSAGLRVSPAEIRRSADHGGRT